MPKRSLPIKHQPQETDAGCLAACAQMALARLGMTVSQDELNRLFELTPLGVPTSRLKRLERYNIRVTIQKEGSLDDLLQAIDQDITPIVFIRTGQLSYWTEDTQHAVLVSGYDGSDLLLNDPAFPNAPQRVSADELLLAWDEFDNSYAILTQ
ncbi:MAG: C39 family peptidase [Chloroflexi bacterium]|nr:C39 family peptidase [Chloroflexota bacterium]